MKALKQLVIVVCLGLLTSATAADLTYTFDTGSSGSDGGGFNSGSFAWSGAYQAVQHTGTAGGWTMGGSGPRFEFGWPAQSTMQTIANNGGGRISFDMLVSAASSFSLGGWMDGDWYQLHFAGNSDGVHGWTQDSVYGPNPVGTNFHPTTPDQHYHFDLSFADMGWEPGDQWFQVFFGSNSDAARPVQFYVDNLEVYQVPEPGTLALAGIGAAALLILRRKRG